MNLPGNTDGMIIVATTRGRERTLAMKKVDHIRGSIEVVGTEVTDRTQDLRHLDQATLELDIGAEIGHAVLDLLIGVHNPAEQLLGK